MSCLLSLPDLRDSSCKHLTQGAGELRHGAEGRLEARPDGPGSGLQGRAVGGVEGREAGALLGAVSHELDQHPPVVGGEGELGGDLIGEAGPWVQLEAVHAAVINLKQKCVCPSEPIVIDSKMFIDQK